MPTPLRPDNRAKLMPTDEQEAILEAFLTGNHAIASALAGTGKTSTLILCCKAFELGGAYWAFNKAIAEEARDRMPPRVKANTSSAWAFRGMIRECPWIQNRLNVRVKPWTMADRLGIDSRGPKLEIAGKKFSASKLANLTADMVSNFCYSDDEELTLAHGPFVRGLETQRDKETGAVIVPSSLPELAELLLPWANQYWKDVQDEEGRLRFSFEHYMKMWALGEIVTPEVPGEYVMVDEAQDLNPVEIGILRRMDKQLLVVGDANQQIYEFRGSVNALAAFGVPTIEHLPLTMSFRFGDEIADAANVFLELLNAPDLVRGNPSRDSWITRRDEEFYPDAILTRSNAGALEMLLGAIDSGATNIAVTGRVKAMSSFIEAAAKMQLGQIVTHPDLTAFSTWGDVQEYVRQTQDRDYAMLVGLIDKYGAERLEAALAGTVELKDSQLAISTAHSAKGLEWSKVALGHDFKPDPERGPVTAAEHRLAYVALTRAIDTLDPGGLASYVRGDTD